MVAQTVKVIAEVADGHGFDTTQRRAGVVLHPTSLPGAGARGSLGVHAYAFVDWIASAGLRLWQILPVGPTHGDLSPYQCQSAFAADASLIDRELPVQAGWLAEPQWDLDIDAWLRIAREAYEARAEAGAVQPLPVTHVSASRIYTFALYRSIKNAQHGAPWWQWPHALRERESSALTAFEASHYQEIADVLFGQALFTEQWQTLRAYAAAAGVAMLGDAPIFVAQDSAEVWAEPHLFLLDEHGMPEFVAGVPPDYFSATGQRWGNPLYNWDAIAADGFCWWLDRIEADLGRVDWLRLDHFRGLEAFWAIPADSDTATVGEWRQAPGDALLAALNAALGHVPLVAEDLGIITPAVDALRDAHDLPGMKVLQFAFGGSAENPYLPHNHRRDCVVYTGTHDNDTTVGWVLNGDPATLEHALEYFDCEPFGLANAMLRAALFSVANTCMLPLQDLLWPDSAHRMNVPGESDGHWRWRFDAQMLRPERAAEIAALVRLSGRTVKPAAGSSSAVEAN